MKHFKFTSYCPIWMLLIVCFLSTSELFAQSKEKVFLSDLILSAVEAQGDTTFSNLEISIENQYIEGRQRFDVNGEEIVIEDDHIPIDAFLKIYYGDRLTFEEGKIVIPYAIEFYDCIFLNNSELSGFYFNEKLSFINNNFEAGITLESNKVGSLLSTDNQYKLMALFNNHFSGNVHFELDKISYAFLAEYNTFDSRMYLADEFSESSFFFEGNVFSKNENIKLFPIKNDSFLFGRSWVLRDRLDLNLAGDPVYFLFTDNIAQEDQLLESFIIMGKFQNYEVTNNILNGFLVQSIAADVVGIRGNDFAYIDISHMSFSETQNKIRWEDIAGNKIINYVLYDFVNDEGNGFESFDFRDIGIPDSAAMKSYAKHQSEIVPIIYLGQQKNELADHDNYKLLISSYYKLHTVLKAEGDIESANSCYIEMKELETRRFKHVFQEDGGFENLFRWQLNILLRAYTDYGTNPAKAVKRSLYIILLFALFYFFFPSEWDKESKKHMIKHFRKLIKKNEHGYFGPFIDLSKGIVLSFINALMLSLNSFVTLGFGRIPTTGLARYVCIIQGFIGWFLLSIFTVALINQVLF